MHRHASEKEPGTSEDPVPVTSEDGRTSGRSAGLTGLAAMVVAAALVGAPAGPAAAQAPEEAQEDVVTDRPDRTESAVAVAPGLFQVEGGWGFSRTADDGVEVEEHGVGELLLRIGVVPRVEARVEFGGWRSRQTETASPGGGRDESGAADLSLGAKAELYETPGGSTRIALLGAASIPTGEAPFTSDAVDPAVRAAVDHELPGPLSLGYNLGVEWETVPDSEGDDTLADLVYTVAVGLDLTSRLGAFVEGFGSAALSEGGAGETALDGGFTYLLRPNLQLDLSGGFGLDDDAEDWFVGAGATVRVPR